MSKIVVSKDGPYLVSGSVPLSIQIIMPNKEGYSWTWKKGKEFDTKSACRLCRCGHSKNKPFCDDTHKEINFVGTETATRTPYAKQAKNYNGPALTLSDAEVLCSSARFCDAQGTIWFLIRGTDDSNVRDLVIHEGIHCPSGRLVLHDNKTGKEVDSKSEPSIEVVEDPVAGCSGPLWIRGGIAIESEDGTPYEQRNRVTLCRCGYSRNKPFCDGSHIRFGFNDGLV